MIARRKFITLLGGAAASWSRPARGQQVVMPVIGFLRSTSPADSKRLVTAFHQGLKEAGFVHGQNVTIEYRWAENQRDRLPTLVTELIRLLPAVIVGNTASALAAKAATTTVPIVFASGSDPVHDGLVASLNRPGGNVTGVFFFGSVLGPKRLELLRQLVATATTIAMLAYPNSPDTEAERKDVEAAAQAIGQQLIVFDVGTLNDIEMAFETSVQRGAGALLVGGGPFFNSHREQVVALVARHGLPASYANREPALTGGLMSYSSSQPNAYREVGIYAARILRGEKPADLPVTRSTKFELVINLNTAEALGLIIPPTLLALADEVIE